MIKRSFDIVFSLIGIIILSPIILLLVFFAAIDTHSNGVFTQKRVGQHAILFTIYKIRTIHKERITTSSYGSFLRKFKLDELPQLINVLIGNMSIVGPRPDVQGYYDMLTGNDRKLLELKPGLTCEASLKYFNEEYLINNVDDKEKFINEVLFPDKVKMNLEYLEKQSFFLDLLIIFKTIFRKWS